MSHHHSRIDVFTIISEINMESLRELCKLAVLKLGISKTDLPKTVRREVEMGYPHQQVRVSPPQVGLPALLVPENSLVQSRDGLSAI